MNKFLNLLENCGMYLKVNMNSITYSINFEYVALILVFLRKRIQNFNVLTVSTYKFIQFFTLKKFSSKNYQKKEKKFSLFNISIISQWKNEKKNFLPPIKLGIFLKIHQHCYEYFFMTLVQYTAN